MSLFKSERMVMEILWREGALPAGKVAGTLTIEAGWSRNTAYTVITKCVEKGYIERGEKFLCTPLLSKEEARKDALDELLMGYFDGSEAELMSVLIGNADKHELKRMKKRIKKLLEDD